jgi:hypothetical protein
MIPYQDLTFRDWDWYWRESVLLYKHEGEWKAFTSCNRNEDHEDDDMEDRLLYDGDMTLERMKARNLKVPLREFPSGNLSPVSISPMNVFNDPDWISYVPELGYVMVGDTLTLLTTRAPRRREKGLTRSRVTAVPVVEPAAVPSSLLSRIPDALPVQHFSRNVTALVKRMNTVASPFWGARIIASMSSDGMVPCVLTPTVAFIPNSGTRGCLLLNGSLLGSVTREGARLTFTPRGGDRGSIEQAMKSWVDRSLVVI